MSPPQTRADSGCGHEQWPDYTGVFARTACAGLGGAYARDAKQAMVLRWDRVDSANGAAVAAAAAQFDTLAAAFAAAAATVSQPSTGTCWLCAKVAHFAPFAPCGATLYPTCSFFPARYSA